MQKDLSEWIDVSKVEINNEVSVKLNKLDFRIML